MSAVAIVELVYHRSPLIMCGGQYLSRLLAVQTISGSMLMGPTTSDASPDHKSVGHDLTAGFVITAVPENLVLLDFFFPYDRSVRKRE